MCLTAHDLVLLIQIVAIACGVRNWHLSFDRADKDQQ